jgi:cytochrome c peroxidase
MNIRIIAVFLLLGAMLAFSRCKPDETDGPVETDADYMGTPYTLTKPGAKWRNIPDMSDNPMTVEGIRLGRMLFWDPVLSGDSTLKCATCHDPALAFTDNKVLSTNIFGPTKRNTPSIQNSVWTKPVFWDGRQASLELACADALLHEQNFNASAAITKLSKKPEYVALFKKAFGRPGDITENKIEKALSQFMRTALSSKSKYDLSQYGQYTLTASEANGLAIFSSEKGDCFHCHTDGPYMTFTDHQFHNNALQEVSSVYDFKDKGKGEAFPADTNEYGKFKTPTLRNLAYTAPYFHDGRYATLEQLVNFYSDSLRLSPTVDPLMKKLNIGGLHLNSQEKTDLIAFLNTLNDESFVADTAFANPFK